MMNYKTEVYDTFDGGASFGCAFVQDATNGRWLEIGRTCNFRTHPCAVRARKAADNLCKRHAKAHGKGPFTLVRA
jgi:hypothetical protein